MSFFGKNKSSGDSECTETDSKEAVDGLKDQYLLTIRSLIVFLKQFALDIQEIESDRFKTEMEEFKDKYLSADSLKQRTKLLNRQTPRVEHYIQRQHAYLTDREKEFRDIIDLLSKAMTGLNTDNQSFYRRVYDHSEKLEEITLLDDLKKIKSALETEVSQIRQAVHDQKKIEHQKIEALAGQVDSLRNELQKTRTQMQTDSLTGVKNRKALDQYLEDMVEQSLMHRRSFALIMFDIDDFKEINDTYGHPVGDRVLVAFAQKCLGMIRSDDFIGRYGGEEFLIILPGASLRNATKKAKHICKSLAETHYAINDKGDTLKVTVSIGVAAMNKNDTSGKIIERADKALYRAKREGKNRVFTEKEI